MLPGWDPDNPYLEEVVRSVRFELVLLAVFFVVVVVLEFLGRPLTRAGIVLFVASTVVLVWLWLGLVGLYRLFRS
ncbi:hypothetical protein RBH26_04310 [Natronolimnohabitans sp. A-GB9]|uniref:hypothetical protein n=1 Tax=Natronolimnohabitans sp. A-GB9 TaxID=3069757 RepID=UPI0027B27EB9|nr:hypothetical protein [Natronolimnohabitans sp. A-GB9]MDQ2049701.1 hypothetical protein [Natronolimnohabitans sp. A-GB9]